MGLDAERSNYKAMYSLTALIILTAASFVSALDLEYNSPVSERFARRREILSEVCKRYKPLVQKSKPQTLKIHAAQNIIYCPILKVGHGTMLGHLMRLTNEASQRLKNIKNLEDKGAWITQLNFTSINALSKYSEAELLSIMRNLVGMNREGKPLIRVIVVRHPMDRIMSAYRMFADGFIEGSKLANMIKMNETIVEKPPGHMAAFLTKIQKNDRKEKKISKWKHTKPYDMACSPCYFQYDYILHLDTLEEDLRYIYQKAGLEYQENEFKLKFHQSKRITKTNDDDYFASLPKEMLRYLYLKYRQDFHLFGFELPEYLKKFESGSSVINEN